MKFGLIAVAAPLVLLAATTVQAQNTASDAASSKPPKEKKICRTEDDTGSIVPKRTCHTKAEWNAINAETQNAVDVDAIRRGQQH